MQAGIIFLVLFLFFGLFCCKHVSNTIPYYQYGILFGKQLEQYLYQSSQYYILSIRTFFWTFMLLVCLLVSFECYTRPLLHTYIYVHTRTHHINTAGGQNGRQYTVKHFFPPRCGSVIIIFVSYYRIITTNNIIITTHTQTI